MNNQIFINKHDLIFSRTSIILEIQKKITLSHIERKRFYNSFKYYTFVIAIGQTSLFQ